MPWVTGGRPHAEDDLVTMVIVMLIVLPKEAVLGDGNGRLGLELGD